MRVYRLVCSGTIEENIYLRQVYKQVSAVSVSLWFVCKISTYVVTGCFDKNCSVVNFCRKLTAEGFNYNLSK